MQHSTFTGLIGPVARELLGDPNPRLSSDRELRYGTHGSLSVDVRNDRWYDHEGDVGGGVVDLLRAQGVERPGDWLRDRGYLPDEPARAESPPAVYDYADEHGEILFQVVRKGGHDFRQRRPDGAGGWTWSVKGVRQVPYRLPELLAAPDDAPVFVVEGEKDVNSVHGLGLVATCNAGGAGKWRAHHAEFLRDRDVVILPDNDDPGRKHAESVAQSLDGIASSVRVLELPGLAHKGDVSDWIAAGGDCGQLLGLVDRCPEYHRQAPGPAAADAHDEALAEWAASEPAPPEPPEDVARESLADSFRSLLQPWSDEEIEAAKQPWPHVFTYFDKGLFPVGEVTIIGARGREGKTTVLTAVAVAAAVGRTIAGFRADPTTTVIYSAEDDRGQYARKIGAQISMLPGEREKIRHRILVPNLDDPTVAHAREIVTVVDRQPMQAAAVDALIEALQPLCVGDAPLRMVIFETASTLSDADEDNRGHKTLIAGLKRVARALGVAVVLVHHTSQAADNNLADLNLSTADIRGGTSLVFNSRQSWLLVNLGNDSDPFPDSDARTVLRRMITEDDPAGGEHRMLVLVPLDSSKSALPHPIFWQWAETDAYGPGAVDYEAPDRLTGRSWRKVMEMVRAERAERRESAKEERKAATADARTRKVLLAIAHLNQSGEPATSRRIRTQAGVSAAVVGEVLSHLETTRQITPFEARVANQKCTAYRLAEGGTAE